MWKKATSNAVFRKVCTNSMSNMDFHVITLFPDQVSDYLRTSMTGRAIESGAIGLDCINIRDFAHNHYGKIDDTIKASTDMYEKNATAVQNAVDKGLESAEGNYYAAQEMASMAADRGESIVNSALIQAQMRAEDVKEKIDGMKKDADKSDKE